nr:uncharacterized protein LOC125180022 [Anser cygnoides]
MARARGVGTEGVWYQRGSVPGGLHLGGVQYRGRSSTGGVEPRGLHPGGGPPSPSQDPALPGDTAAGAGAGAGAKHQRGGGSLVAHGDTAASVVQDVVALPGVRIPAPKLLAPRPAAQEPCHHVPSPPRDTAEDACARHACAHLHVCRRLCAHVCSCAHTCAAVDVCACLCVCIHVRVCRYVQWGGIYPNSLHLYPFPPLPWLWRALSLLRSGRRGRTDGWARRESTRPHPRLPVPVPSTGPGVDFKPCAGDKGCLHLAGSTSCRNCQHRGTRGCPRLGRGDWEPQHKARKWEPQRAGGHPWSGRG